MSMKISHAFWVLVLASAFGAAYGLRLSRGGGGTTVAMPDPGRASAALAAMEGSRQVVATFEPAGDWLSLEVPTPAPNGGAAPAAMVDLDWMRFDRTHDFPRMVKRIKSGDVTSAEGLFRNVDLNPTDVRLPEAVREFLHSLTSTFCADVDRLRKEIRLLQNSEFDTLVGADAARKSSYADYLSSLTIQERSSHDALVVRSENVRLEKLKDRGFADAQVVTAVESFTFDPNRIFGDGVVSFRVDSGGVIRAAKLEDLPKTREAEMLLTWLSTQYAERVVGAFVSAGCIGPDSAARILGAVEVTLTGVGDSKKRKNKKRKMS